MWPLFVIEKILGNGAILLCKTTRDDASDHNCNSKRPRSLWAGVARHNGKALFVKDLLPQETAEITLIEDKRQYARGK
jgi:hypothetical protein